MTAHQGFNSFSKCSSRFFLEELKYSSSCIPKCNSFYLIFFRWCYVFLDNFPSCFMIHKLSGMTYFKPIIFQFGHENFCNSSILFIGVILGYILPKAFQRIVAIYGAYKWPKFFIHPSSEISFSSPCWYQSNLLFLLVAEFSLHSFEMLSISPLQAYSFRCWFSNNSVITLL